MQSHTEHTIFLRVSQERQRHDSDPFLKDGLDNSAASVKLLFCPGQNALKYEKVQGKAFLFTRKKSSYQMLNPSVTRKQNLDEIKYGPAPKH